MSETSRVYTDTTTGSTASFRERALCEERRWEEAGFLVAEIASRASGWFRPPPDVEKHFRQACIEQLRGVRAMIDYQIAIVDRGGRPTTGTRICVE
jgi:hypothetical protein